MKRLTLLFTITFILQNCGNVQESGLESDANFNDRRIYANDPASNDSLNSAVFTGFTFYAQPGARYRLNVWGLYTDDPRLYMFRLGGRGEAVKYLEPLSGEQETVDSDSATVFSFTAPDVEFEKIWGILRDKQGNKIRGPAEDVRLDAVGAFDSLAFSVNFHCAGDYSGYTGNDAGIIVSRAGKALGDIFFKIAGINLRVNGPFFIESGREIVVKLPDGFLTEFDISEGDNSGVNVVIVEKILSDSTDQTILGVSPREAWKMNSDSKNLLIVSMENNNVALEYTFAHELGHFLGLRHTISTSMDIMNDNDWSNLEDGFPDTEFCIIPYNPVARGSFRQQSFSGRVLDNSKNLEFCSINARINLMFPYADIGSIQSALSVSQIHFLRKNLSLLPH